MYTRAHQVLGAVLGLGLMVTGLGSFAAAGTRGQESGERPTYQPAVVIQLAVSDLDRSVAFYTETLGLELDVRVEALRWAKVKTAIPGLMIGLSETDVVSGSGTASVNLAVGDADRARVQLEAAGVQFHGETIDIPGVVRLADFDDPDGNRLRIAGPSSQR
jgi:predicted enzyme related to lactoylglutathione lyase